VESGWNTAGEKDIALYRPVEGYARQAGDKPFCFKSVVDSFGVTAQIWAQSKF
jgi:hypothetical protein